jgi:anti-sigma regulatory factor (Ser/Thr protein kinase)
MSESVTIPIRNAFDTITARVKVREFAREQGLDITGQARISLAAYALVNAAELGNVSQGQLIIKALKKGKRAGIEVDCVIPDVGNNCFAPETFENTKWLVDEFTVENLPSKEIQVALIQWSPPPKGRVQ